MTDPKEPTEEEILAQQLEHLDAEPLKMGDPLAEELEAND
jgi:hypothetical protein